MGVDSGRGTQRSEPLAWGIGMSIVPQKQKITIQNKTKTGTPIVSEIFKNHTEITGYKIAPSPGYWESQVPQTPRKPAGLTESRSLVRGNQENNHFLAKGAYLVNSQNMKVIMGGKN